MAQPQRAGPSGPPQPSQPARYVLYHNARLDESEPPRKRRIIDLARHVGKGHQGTVRLVYDLRGTRLRVRKAPLDFGDDSVLEEIQILKLLGNERALACGIYHGLDPRITWMRYENDCPAPTQGLATEHDKIIYLDACNCRDLRAWLGDLTDLGLYQHGLPFALIARCMHQMLQSLQYMYQHQVDPIFHRDLNDWNIFVHLEDHHPNTLPDFYIGDFGHAQVYGKTDLEFYTTMSLEDWISWDLPFVIRIFETLVAKCRADGTTIEMLYDEDPNLEPLFSLWNLMHDLDHIYQAQRIVPPGVTTVQHLHIPDLRPAIEQARLAEEAMCVVDGNLEAEWTRLLPVMLQRPQNTDSYTYDTRLAARTYASKRMRAHRTRPEQVRHPWFVGRADAATGEILELDVTDVAGGVAAMNV